MSGYPEFNEPEENQEARMDVREEAEPAPQSALPAPVNEAEIEACDTSIEPREVEPALFDQFSEPLPPPPPQRTPNLLHLGLLVMFLGLGEILSGLLTQLAIRSHFLGVANQEQAIGDVRYLLGSEGLLYLLTFAICLVAFPMVWKTSYFTGVHWRASAALLSAGKLAAAACGCFVLAIVDSILLPGPENAPIDKIFHSPGAVWPLFIFGVTFAPFFEEMAFRGFLLPALCTAWDWSDEHIHRLTPLPLDKNGHPQWSLPAMIIASIATSVPFALMHAEQTGYSWGPFLLLFSVSLVLCWARLSTRSLAASTLLHCCYNCLIFSSVLRDAGSLLHLSKI